MKPTTYGLGLFLPFHLITIGGAIYLMGTSSWSLPGLLLFVAGWLTFGTLGTNIGLHRTISHRFFQTSVITRNTLALLGTFTCGSPLAWALIHRWHHQSADTPQDWHTPRRGFWWSFFGWMLIDTSESETHGRELPRHMPRRLIADLLHSKFLIFLHKHYLPVVWIIIAVAAAIDWKFALAFIVAPSTFLIHQESMINFLGHYPRFGYRNFETPDDSRNQNLFGWLSFGAGYQNNHHAKPLSANFADKPGEIDLGYQIGRMLFRQTSDRCAPRN